MKKAQTAEPECLGIELEFTTRLLCDYGKIIFFCTSNFSMSKQELKDPFPVLLGLK